MEDGRHVEVLERKAGNEGFIKTAIQDSYQISLGSKNIPICRKVKSIQASWRETTL